jgi:hypothetical protein
MGIDIVILALSMVGFTLLVSFSFEDGNIFSWAISSLKEWQGKAESRFEAILKVISNERKQAEWLEAAIVPPHQPPIDELQRLDWHVAFAVATHREPTMQERAEYKTVNHRKMASDTQIVQYHLFPFEIGEGLEELQSKLKDNQRLHCITNDVEACKARAEAIKINHKIRAVTDELKAQKKVDFIEYIIKPIYGCPICMLFWYGTAFFAAMWLTGVAGWLSWMPAMACAYGILLAPAFIKSFSE